MSTSVYSKTLTCYLVQSYLLKRLVSYTSLTMFPYENYDFFKTALETAGSVSTLSLNVH